MDKIIAAVVVLIIILIAIRIAWVKSNTWKCTQCGNINDNSDTECIGNCRTPL